LFEPRFVPEVVRNHRLQRTEAEDDQDGHCNAHV